MSTDLCLFYAINSSTAVQLMIPWLFACGLWAEQAHITAAIVDYRTPHKRRKQGLCTAWLAQLGHASAQCTATSPEAREATAEAISHAERSNGTGSSDRDDEHDCSSDRVPVWVSKGVLRLPADLSKPLILVGPGTGVAPFRAFLEERAALAAAGVQALSHVSASL